MFRFREDPNIKVNPGIDNVFNIADEARSVNPNLFRQAAETSSASIDPGIYARLNDPGVVFRPRIDPNLVYHTLPYYVPPTQSGVPPVTLPAPTPANTVSQNELLLLVNSIPFAQDGNVITKEYHNSMRAALIAITHLLVSNAQTTDTGPTPTPTANKPVGISIFTNQTPATPDSTDGQAWELGTRFKSDVDGEIQSIRFWKSPSDTGTHVGRIWNSAGNQLAQVTFANETASGWQEAKLTTPLAITANTIYTVSANTNTHFPFSDNGLQSAVTNGHLSTVADNNNGVFANKDIFPTQTSVNRNYFRDVVFVPKA